MTWLSIVYVQTVYFVAEEFRVFWSMMVLKEIDYSFLTRSLHKKLCLVATTNVATLIETILYILGMKTLPSC